MLGTLGFEGKKWKEQIKQNIETYELWKTELIRDIYYMKSLYDDKSEFSKDFKNGKEKHKYLRLYDIRKKEEDKEKAMAVPPVLGILTPCRASDAPSSAIPLLSDTLTSAQRIGVVITFPS